MDWNNTLYLSIFGVVVTVSISVFVTWLGLRYRREIPKLPILESLEALKLQKEEEEASLAEIQEDLFNARNAIKEAEQARAYLEAAKPEIESLRQQISEFEQSKSTALSEAEKATQELAKLEQAVDEATKNKAELDQELGPLNAELANAKVQLDQAQEKLKDFEQKQTELATIEAKLPAAREEAEELAKKCTESRTELQELVTEHNQLQAEHARLVGTVDGLKAQHDQLLTAIDNLNKTHASAGGISQDHDPCQDLWQPTFVNHQPATKAADEQAMLEGMATKLEEANVQFSRRTLFSFHTALKTQSISPLTVLAGISGTGKSLLPSLYAKCMGIHFLNLPVQPGWNSPQDLFGFYNYIEQKFKATPMARALIQFDRYGRSQWPLPQDNQSFGDQMLLILLDEMNLARVEYYFSELLSRLELRRNINPDSAADRQKVEVPLEIGHAVQMTEGGIVDMSVSLYPGENVLFTGTMNEDESTMSLSDKVLDRATVLRFGKPKQVLGDRPSTSAIPESKPLAFQTWKSWIRNGQGIGQEIQEAIHRLAEIMGQAGVPFGYRVAQGMREYVENYPKSDRNGQRDALVDQIEQKMLPKLRGRDLEDVGDPLQHLRRLVMDLGDHALVAAIEKGQSHDIFHWTGLDRLEH